MPFDTLQRDEALTMEDVLASIDIVSIPAQVIHRHRHVMSQRYSHKTYSRWIEVDLPNDERLVQRLTRPAVLPRPAAAPHAVVALAEEIRTTLPNARFVLGYFERDPYLKVWIPGVESVAYIGLWLSSRRLKAIARRTTENSWRFRALQVRTFVLG